MLRRSVTYLLILAVAAGPMLCCCTVERLHAASPAPVSLKTSEPQLKVARSCCSHRPCENDQKSSHSKPAPQKPSEKCPCKDKDSAAKVAPTESVSADVASLLRLALSLDAGNALVVECLSSLSAGLKFPVDPLRGPNASLVSTDELLFAHHNLRC